MNPAKKSHAAVIIAYRDQASQGITAPRLVKPTYRLIEATHSNRITEKPWSCSLPSNKRPERPRISGV